ncbi:MAG: SAM-dependent methyltransferase [Bacteroidetes bacterium RIFOXYA12_FULL_35_11]|nr:MAG: SAM-dependent methyltransferase [Bacteroidetes bacterium GWF2_35_48]OFY73221.1 MAG: SAM-dependent methyltransferase [Bacteroidetes bacterium RIFOXYA12_FULL_35_11]OFY96837.1 MAG: SAM-dependent methyltransferase [Bacteroidetes bacterium RIFOXYB2_FULL_35_7]OFZ04707.1 MAG: SAM-dependent methyltransferase [Bacteroidetes bacterium RIFOXYC12_FULL_35_7]HBX51232.1 SAM-dependent methyltransferase [Bacteroidales bacterium]
MNIAYNLKFLKYHLFAKHRNGHGIHSPFVYELLTTVIESDDQFYTFNDIENLRIQLLTSTNTIEVTDFGAGSKVQKSPIRKIKNIVKYSARNSKYGQLLFRLVTFFEPKTILELGTSLGFSTMYLAAPYSKTTVYTFEGCLNLSKMAKYHFSLMNLKNIQQITGNFKTTLPETLKKIKKLDFVFFDGNHRYEPTVNYFQLCLEKAHEESVFIFDDIHWSHEMELAWKQIKNHPKVVLTIDLFFLGIVFFNTEISKQHFTIKF